MIEGLFSAFVGCFLALLSLICLIVGLFVAQDYLTNDMEKQETASNILNAYERQEPIEMHEDSDKVST